MKVHLKYEEITIQNCTLSGPRCNACFYIDRMSYMTEGMPHSTATGRHLREDHLCREQYHEAEKQDKQFLDSFLFIKL